MIPNNDGLLLDFELEDQASKTYRLDIDKNIIVGTCDNLESVKQAIYLMLSIERFEWIIYSWNYGVELSNLFGKSISYVLPEIKRRVTECLLEDDRITSVSDFNFETSKNVVHATFTVHTIYGNIETGVDVNV